MDVNTWREVATVAAFVTFIGIWIWAWRRGNRERFDEAARLPFQQED